MVDLAMVKKERKGKERKEGWFAGVTCKEHAAREMSVQTKSKGKRQWMEFNAIEKRRLEWRVVMVSGISLFFLLNYLLHHFCPLYIISFFLFVGYSSSSSSSSSSSQILILYSYCWWLPFFPFFSFLSPHTLKQAHSRLPQPVFLFLFLLTSSDVHTLIYCINPLILGQKSSPTFQPFSLIFFFLLLN